MTPELKDRFLRMACDLSPENLSCDGECSRAETMRRYKAIKAKWKAAEKEAGRTVSEDEVWGWSFGGLQ